MFAGEGHGEGETNSFEHASHLSHTGFMDDKFTRNANIYIRESPLEHLFACPTLDLKFLQQFVILPDRQRKHAASELMRVIEMVNCGALVSILITLSYLILIIENRHSTFEIKLQLTIHAPVID
ncbi:hypothetical protein V6N13_147943 [Hibiscus sabdariffa]